MDLSSFFFFSHSPDKFQLIFIHCSLFSFLFWQNKRVRDQTSFVFLSVAFIVSFVCWFYFWDSQFFFFGSEIHIVWIAMKLRAETATKQKKGRKYCLHVIWVSGTYFLCPPSVGHHYTNIRNSYINNDMNVLWLR